MNIPKTALITGGSAGIGLELAKNMRKRQEPRIKLRIERYCYRLTYWNAIFSHSKG